MLYMQRSRKSVFAKLNWAIPTSSVLKENNENATTMQCKIIQRIYNTKDGAASPGVEKYQMMVDMTS